MKLIGLYSHSSIPYLERNHRNFADSNGFSYENYFVKNYYEKYRLIYSLLQKAPNEVFGFIDSNSYFIEQKFDFPLPEHILINCPPGQTLENEDSQAVMDNFFVIRSTYEAMKCLEKVTADVSYYFLGDRKIDPAVPFPKKFIKNHHYQSGNTYWNIDIPAHKEFFNYKNILVAHLNPNKAADFFSYANLLCAPAPDLPDIPQTDFEVINPGMSNALLTLYTPEIALQGAVCERNLTRYCQFKGLTLYVYRNNPRASENVSGAWLKPELLLRHIVDHKHIAWVDSDILVSMDYELETSREFTAYQDIGNWKFNSGFLVFKNSEKASNYLNDVVNRCESITDRSKTRVNKGDQGQFIAEAEKHFPDFLPISNQRVNLLPGYEFNGDRPLVVHFVGMPTHARARIMNHYDSLYFEKQTIASMDFACSGGL
jgi:hypothetical protein